MRERDTERETERKRGRDRERQRDREGETQIETEIKKTETQMKRVTARASQPGGHTPSSSVRHGLTGAPIGHNLQTEG